MINFILIRRSAVVLLGAILCVSSATAQGTAALRAKLESGKPVRIVCFGDSVTGLYYHTGGRRSYTDMLGIALRKAIPKANVTMVNAGISGNTTIAGLKRIDRDVIAQKSDLVTVMFGLNVMVRQSLDRYRENLEQIVERCRASGSQVLLCTPNAVTDTPNRPTQKLLQFCAVMREVAAKHKVPLCDTYAAFAELRERNHLRWRLTMSDPIHPNMGGHRFIAEQIAKSITGKSVSLDGTPPPEEPLQQVREKIKNGKPIRVLAMNPFHPLISPILKAAGAKNIIDVTVWNIGQKSLSQIEIQARSTVRKMKPDLVVIAVPREAAYTSEEEFIKAHTWIQNWSLSFGRQEWDCVVVHPGVHEPEVPKHNRDDLIRKLVSAHDLHLIDRSDFDGRPGGEIIRSWFVRGLKD